MKINEFPWPWKPPSSCKTPNVLCYQQTIRIIDSDRRGKSSQVAISRLLEWAGICFEEREASLHQSNGSMSHTNYVNDILPKLANDCHDLLEKILSSSWMAHQHMGPRWCQNQSLSITGLQRQALMADKQSIFRKPTKLSHAGSHAWAIQQVKSKALEWWWNAAYSADGLGQSASQNNPQCSKPSQTTGSMYNTTRQTSWTQIKYCQQPIFVSQR